jgi:outer membrane protein TolC
MERRRRTRTRVRHWALLSGLLATTSAAASVAAQNDADVLTLDDAVRIALEQNRSLAVAALQVARAERNVEAARSRRWPTLELQATAGSTLNTIRVSYPAGAFGDYTGIGRIPSEDTVVEAAPSVSGNLSATLAQPLTQLHRIGLHVKASELTREAEQARLREQKTALVAEVRGLYYELLQRESAVRASQEEIRALRELGRVVGRQVAIEVALRADGLDVEARAATAEHALAVRLGDLAGARERMNLLLGRDVFTTFSVAALPEEEPAEETDLAAALQSAVARRPDLAQARLAVEQADTELRITKAESIPDLSLAVTYYSFVNVDLLPRNVALAGVQLKWEPFDWGRRGKEKAEKALRLAQATTRAHEAADRVRVEVRERHRRLQQARLLVAAKRLSRDAASERWRLATARHRQHTVLLKDLLETQAARSAAHAEYERALLTLLTERAEFRKSIGEEQ